MTARFPGDPGVGKVYWGAAYGSNTDPAPLETGYAKLGVRRTYFGGNSSGATGLVSRASADLAANRLPWVSIKCPGTWAQVAAGTYDSFFADISTGLNALDGPVWMTVHHEPEGDGSISDWKAMQTRLSPILRSSNVAFAPVFTAYDTFFASGTYGLDKYFVSGIWDFLGWDFYNLYGSTNSHGLITVDSSADSYLALMAAACTSDGDGLPFGVAEFGVNDKRYVDKGAGWISSSFSAAISRECVAMAYFDSNLNPIGGSTWPVENRTDKYSEWHAALVDADAIHWADDIGGPPPVDSSNDDIADAYLLSGSSGSVIFDTTGYTTETDEPHDTSYEGTAWAKYIAPASLGANTTLVLDTGGTDEIVTTVNDTVMTVYTNGPVMTDLVEVRFGDIGSTGEYARVSIELTAGVTYYIQLGPYTGISLGPIQLDWSLAVPPINDDLASAIALGASGSTSVSMAGATLEPLEPDVGQVFASAWYSWTTDSDPPATVTFTVSVSGQDTGVGVYSGNDYSDLVLIDEDYHTPSSVTITTPDADTEYWVRVGAYTSAGVHTITWDQNGVDPAADLDDPDDTGTVASEGLAGITISGAASLELISSVPEDRSLRTRPTLGIQIDMPEPAIINGRPVLPLYWAKMNSSISLTVGSGHIEAIPDPDPVAVGDETTDAAWPLGGKPDWWWTVKDLSDPGAGNQVRLSTLPEHFGGPDFKSSGVYRPTLQHRDHFGAGGKYHTYTRALIFEPSQVNHMWVNLGSELEQPYTVMIAGIILSYPTRTYGHYLLDAGRPTPTKDTDFDWTIDDNLSYRSLMLFQRSSGLICSRLVVEDGVYARVKHNYVPRPRVFMGIFNGNNSRVGWFDTKMKKTAKGRTDDNNVQRLVMGRRTNHISDNLATHFCFFEMRIWDKALTKKQWHAQYRQMAATWKFIKFEKEGI